MVHLFNTQPTLKKRPRVNSRRRMSLDVYEVTATFMIRAPEEVIETNIV
jgi:hypothetical protein